MASIKKETGSRPNRIRFVMLDADISDGNLSELTQAITSALKPNSGHIRQLPSRTSIPALPTASQEDGAGSDEGPEDVAEPLATEEVNQDGALSRAGKPKAKLPVPEYLHDLDVNGNGTSFRQFAETHAPKNHTKRYLVSALWLKEHGNNPTINIHKVYTLYKTAGWPIGINDWDATFRSAVKANYMRRVNTGEYAINPLGEEAIGKSDE